MRPHRCPALAGVLILLLALACGGSNEPVASRESEQWLEVQVVAGPTERSREGVITIPRGGIKPEVLTSGIVKITPEGLPQQVLGPDGNIPIQVTWLRSASLPKGPGVELEHLRVQIPGPVRVNEAEFLTDVTLEPEQPVLSILPEYSAVGLVYDNGSGGSNVYVRARWLAKSPAAG